MLNTLINKFKKQPKPTEVAETKEIKSPVDKLMDLKKTKWEAFCNKHATRIAFYPKQGDRKSIPAVWNDKLQDWVWVSRKSRRHLARKNKR